MNERKSTERKIFENKELKKVGVKERKQLWFGKGMKKQYNNNGKNYWEKYKN